MTVPVKPTESLTWAESGPPTPPGSTTPTEPSTGRKDTGYGFEEPLPHSEFNWLFRTLNRWMNWVTEKMDLHVHDGGTDPESVSKVDFDDHIDYGTNGFLEIATDTGSVHEISHGGTATTKRITTGNFNGATLNLSGAFTGASMNLSGNATVSGNLTSARVPRGVARVKGDGTYYSNSGFDAVIVYSAGQPGRYQLAFDGLNPAVAKIVAEVTLADATATDTWITAEPIDSLGIRVINVEVRNSSGYVDFDFSVVGYVLP